MRSMDQSEYVIIDVTVDADVKLTPAESALFHSKIFFMCYIGIAYT